MTHVLDREGIDDGGRAWRAEYVQGAEVPQWLLVVDERVLGTIVGGRGSEEAFIAAVHAMIQERLAAGG